MTESTRTPKRAPAPARRMGERPDGARNVDADPGDPAPGTARRVRRAPRGHAANGISAGTRGTGPGLGQDARPRTRQVEEVAG